MGLQELRAGRAGWQPAGVMRPKMGLQELRAGSPQGLAGCRGFETQDGLTRAAGWQPAGVLRPKMGLQELRAGSLQGF